MKLTDFLLKLGVEYTNLKQIKDIELEFEGDRIVVYKVARTPVDEIRVD